MMVQYSKRCINCYINNRWSLEEQTHEVACRLAAMPHKNVLVRDDQNKSIISTYNIKANSADRLTAVPIACMGAVDALCFSAVSVSLLLRCTSHGTDHSVHQIGGVKQRCANSRRAKERCSFTKMCGQYYGCGMRCPFRPRFLIHSSCIHG